MQTTKFARVRLNQIAYQVGYHGKGECVYSMANCQEISWRRSGDCVTIRHGSYGAVDILKQHPAYENEREL